MMRTECIGFRVSSQECKLLGDCSFNDSSIFSACDTSRNILILCEDGLLVSRGNVEYGICVEGRPTMAIFVLVDDSSIEVSVDQEGSQIFHLCNNSGEIEVTSAGIVNQTYV